MQSAAANLAARFSPQCTHDCFCCSQAIFNTNLQGPKRMCDAFLPLLDPSCGRFVNVSSGSASGYISKTLGANPASPSAVLTSFDVTWEQIEAAIAAENQVLRRTAVHRGSFFLGFRVSARSRSTWLFARRRKAAKCLPAVPTERPRQL